MKGLSSIVLTVSAFVLAIGLWTPIKALLAQELLVLAWAESQARQQTVRPWPWADTWPVARLVLDENRHSFIVLHGAHGESLAFGPGQVLGDGPTVIAGHRDTHFRVLQELDTGHRLSLQRRDGRWRTFEVSHTRIVDSRYERINTAMLPPDTLLLVTCFPFDSLKPRGPLRFVVEARALGPENITVVDS